MTAQYLRRRIAGHGFALLVPDDNAVIGAQSRQHDGHLFPYPSRQSFLFLKRNEELVTVNSADGGEGENFLRRSFDIRRFLTSEPLPIQRASEVA